MAVIICEHFYRVQAGRLCIGVYRINLSQSFSNNLIDGNYSAEFLIACASEVNFFVLRK